jgi:addiction module HigA family antidote
LSAVLNGRAGVSADMALRLSVALGTRPDFWLRLQMQRDLWVAKQNPPKRIVKLAA